MLCGGFVAMYGTDYEIVNFFDLKGKVIKEVKGLFKDSEVVLFFCEDGDVFMMHREQDCCEDVRIEDIIGDIKDLLNKPILVAEENTNEGDSEEGTYTWTFYKLATEKGYVDIRWYGTSNGFYSESVDIVKIKNKKYLDNLIKYVNREEYLKDD